MGIKAAVIATSIIFFTGAAHADWQYTRWGMTIDQVAAASNGSLRPCTVKGCEGPSGGEFEPKLFGPYTSGKFNFTAFSLFDKSGGLARIYLRLEDPAQASRLHDALTSKYGNPSTKDAGFLHITYWQPQADRIELRSIGDGKRKHVTLTYSPRISPSNKGL